MTPWTTTAARRRSGPARGRRPALRLPVLRLPVLLVPVLLAAAAAVAAPLVPDSDAQVVERLPPRLLPRPAAAGDGAPVLAPAQAAAAARRLIEQARAGGDPRPAGQALALLAPWRAAPDAPAEVTVMLATTEQYLHDFDSAAQRLQALLARAPAQPQALLTLATIRRVQGRYADADTACRALAQGRAAPLHARACLAENAGLRGRVEEARAAFEQLLQEAGDDPASRSWLLTSLGELQARAGRVAAAERAFRDSLRLQPDTYTALALADLLLAQGRGADVPPLLRLAPRSDAVLLRLAAAGARQAPGHGPALAPMGTAASPTAGLRGGSRGAAVGTAGTTGATGTTGAAGTAGTSGPPRSADDAAAATAELRERMAQAALRPGTAALDARERALFELELQRDARAALAAARENAAHQREPLDLLLLARAARAAGDAAALTQTRQLLAEVGLHDRRIEAVLEAVK